MGSIAIESLQAPGTPDVQDTSLKDGLPPSEFEVIEASQAPADETVLLSAADSSVQIEYWRDAMETIRKRSWEGLMVSPRFGIGVGGLLLGVREHGRIRLLDSIDIPCSHSMGPSFNLTADEKRESLDLIAAAGALDPSGKVEVIGWYCSKTRDGATLNEADLNLHAELFPGSSKIALVVRPSVVDLMRAAFFLRDENAALVKSVECEVDIWWSEPKDAPEVAASEHETEMEPRAHYEFSAGPEAPEPQPMFPTAGVSTEVKDIRLLEGIEFAETGLSDLLNLSSSLARPFATYTFVRPRDTVSVPDPESKSKTLPLEAEKLGWMLAAGAAVAIGMLTKRWSKSRPRTSQFPTW